jgi:hypothetical protein
MRFDPVPSLPRRKHYDAIRKGAVLRKQTCPFLTSLGKRRDEDHADPRPELLYQALEVLPAHPFGFRADEHQSNVFFLDHAQGFEGLAGIQNAVVFRFEKEAKEISLLLALENKNLSQA